MQLNIVVLLRFIYNFICEEYNYSSTNAIVKLDDVYVIAPKFMNQELLKIKRNFFVFLNLDFHVFIDRID